MWCLVPCRQLARGRMKRWRMKVDPRCDEVVWKPRDMYWCSPSVDKHVTIWAQCWVSQHSRQPCHLQEDRKWFSLAQSFEPPSWSTTRSVQDLEKLEIIAVEQAETVGGEVSSISKVKSCLIASGSGISTYSVTERQERINDWRRGASVLCNMVFGLLVCLIAPYIDDS